MSKFLQAILLLVFTVSTSYATKLKGHVYDKSTGEPLAGATVVIEKTDKLTVTGLDGSFELKAVPKGPHTLKVRYITFRTWIKEINILDEDNPSLKIYLESETTNLKDVTITTRNNGAAEQEARRIEQQAVQVMNIVSGRAIEVSPDLTIANVIQRVSGVSVERNSNGDAQHAILRGMDKRYNYTLVNGVKIPSPDNQYRYVPLDLFPSDLLDRLEVYKSLTPNMEADAVGGAVNMVMKDAPEKLQITANLGTGINQLFMDRKFMAYDYGSVNFKSPYEINGRSYQASSNDFSKGVFRYKAKTPQPNLVGSLSVGQRFLNNKLGMLLAGSYQNTFRGSNSSIYGTSGATISESSPFVSITDKNVRQFSEEQQRYGFHSKLDYVVNSRHKLSLYSMYFLLNNIQVRDAVSTTYNGVYNPDAGNAELVYSTRSRLTKQQIYSSTLQGDHHFFQNRLKMHWAGVFASAKNDMPDNSTIRLNGLRQNFVETRTVLVTTAPVSQRWERNTDEDKAGYLDFTYLIPSANKIEISFGGLYRDKQRSNFFNNYTMAPVDASAKFGDAFTNYTEISLMVTNPTGGVNNPLTYEASEKVGAGYASLKFQINKLEALGGMRIEHTDQGYHMLFSAGELRPTGNQVYTELLPSVSLKYKLNKLQQLHGSYFRSLNRPGFYELIPGGANFEEYKERGNPDLKHALADNYDLRYELFPKSSEQILVGVFHKRIQNPIEYSFQADPTRPQDTYYTPGNFGTAQNYGAELDYIRYFHKFGIKANYTYTHSSITTPKTTRRINSTTGDIEAYQVNQSRPLFGQSEHIANMSLLYKDTKKGWETQLAGAYTGERINTVSQFLNNDLWQKGFIQMDLSAEKQFKNHLSVFFKAGNLLNTPAKLFIKGTNPINNDLKEPIVSNGETLIRTDYYQQSYLLGLRYKL